ncbi:hypothetical protein QYF36_007112 [Acer negundo]|nr:hypothetical protein QYF36_007112 [Acer negundo]
MEIVFIVNLIPQSSICDGRRRPFVGSPSFAAVSIWRPDRNTHIDQHPLSTALPIAAITHSFLVPTPSALIGGSSPPAFRQLLVPSTVVPLLFSSRRRSSLFTVLRRKDRG